MAISTLKFTNMYDTIHNKNIHFWDLFIRLIWIGGSLHS